LTDEEAAALAKYLRQPLAFGIARDIPRHG
jgi:hypothetical protein